MGFISDVSLVFKDSAVQFVCTPHLHYSGPSAWSLSSIVYTSLALKAIAMPVLVTFRDSPLRVEFRTLYTNLGVFFLQFSALHAFLYIPWLPGGPYSDTLF